MSNIKLTDAEVKKALECCKSGSNAMCSMCPMWKVTVMPLCFSELSIFALDLINRQEFRIYQQEKTIMEIQNANLIDFKATIGNYIAENESLKAEVERLKEKSIADDKLLNDRVQEAITTVSKANQKYVDAFEKAFNDKVAEFKEVVAENIRLDKVISDGAEVCHNCHAKYDEKIKQAKTEAYKECIEKVKETSNKTELVCSGALVRTEYTITKKTLDNLLKEFERKEDTIYDD